MPHEEEAADAREKDVEEYVVQVLVQKAGAAGEECVVVEVSAEKEFRAVVNGDVAREVHLGE